MRPSPSSAPVGRRAPLARAAAASRRLRKNVLSVAAGSITGEVGVQIYPRFDRDDRPSDDRRWGEDEMPVRQPYSARPCVRHFDKSSPRFAPEAPGAYRAPRREPERPASKGLRRAGGAANGSEGAGASESWRLPRARPGGAREACDRRGPERARSARRRGHRYAPCAGEVFLPARSIGFAFNSVAKLW